MNSKQIEQKHYLHMRVNEFINLKRTQYRERMVISLILTFSTAERITSVSYWIHTVLTMSGRQKCIRTSQ